MIGLCFLVLPFTYFYAEEALSSDDDFNFGDNLSDDEEEVDTKPSYFRKQLQDKALNKIVDRSYKASRHTVSLYLRVD